MKASNVVSEAVTELNRQVKEIKQSDEQDLGKLAELFDEVAHTADQAATTLARADRALSGEEDEEEPEPEEGVEEPVEEEETEED